MPTRRGSSLSPPSASGDVLLAGFLAARLAEQPLDEALRRGVAAGAASTLELGAGRFEPREAARLQCSASTSRELEPGRGAEASGAAASLGGWKVCSSITRQVERLLELDRKFAKEGLTFDDVLLVPAESRVLPNDVSTATQLTRELRSRFPSSRRRWTP